MGLDRDDTVIRRRLRQKLEFLVEDSLDAAPVTDADLQAWLEATSRQVPDRARGRVSPGLPEPGPPGRRRSSATRRRCSRRLSAAGAGRSRRRRRPLDAAARGGALLAERHRAPVRRGLRRRGAEDRARPLGGTGPVGLRPAPGLRATRAAGGRLPALAEVRAGRRARAPLGATQATDRRDVRDDALALQGGRGAAADRAADAGGGRGQRRRDEAAVARPRPLALAARRVSRGARDAARASSSCARPAPRPTASCGRSPPAARSRSTSLR